MNINDHNKESFLERLLQGKCTYIILTIVFFAFSFLCFKWGRPFHMFNKDYIIDHELFGTFGDFFGGVLGTIFTLISVLLVVRTFKYQQSVTRDNQRQQETQRFNDLFFELLRLYQAQEKELQYYHQESVGNVVSDNKDFFFELNKKMAEKFTPSLSFSQNRKDAVKTYIDTVIDYKDKLSICYRTIFQILNLIEKGTINPKEKKEYLKILRSQLTESELLFLRYHIKSGGYIRYAFLINKSNLMKHLPLFDLLEFKYWRDKLDPVEIKYANDFFINLFKAIRKEKQYVTAVDRSISANIYRANYSLKVVITKNINSTWISKFNSKEFENLCEGVLKEVVMFSNYSCYNNYKELEFSPAQINNNTVIVEVHNRKRKDIKVVFDNNMKYEDIKAIF